MKTIWNYWKAPGGIRILGARSESRSLRVPEEIGGVPVTEIGAYAFSASETPERFKVPETEICEYIQEEGLFDLSGGKELPEVSGDRLTEIFMPDRLIAIGDYAFYGCRELKRLGFSSSLMRTGTGLFVSCSSVNAMDYHMMRKESKALTQMLSEVRYKVTVTICDDSEGRSEISKLVFPEYFEMSVENLAARLFESHYQGAGYRYRQSFKDKKINYKFYDEQLEESIALSPKEVTAELALDRLRYPLELTDERKKAYLDFFSRFAWEAGAWLVNRDNAEDIRFLAEEGAFDGNTDTVSELFMIASRAEAAANAEGTGDFYTQAMGESGYGGFVQKSQEEEELAKRKSVSGLDVMLEIAGQRGKTEVVSILMDYRHRKQGKAPKKRKTFDL